jgi:putative tricarboxylic transport membrane protein
MILEALESVFSLSNLLFINLGVIIGIIFGAIPGLNANVAMVVFLPMTFALQPVTALNMILGMFVAGKYGGSISSILLGTPGTAGAAATVIDGYPLAKKGYAKKALEMSLTASTIGGLFSALVLLGVTPLISKVALTLTAPEYFMLAMFGLTVIAAVSGENIYKGLFMGSLGIFISTVGMDAVSGVNRFTFKSLSLYSGISMLPFMIGAFAVSVFFQRIYDKEYEDKLENKTTLVPDDKLTLKELNENKGVIAKSTIIGTIIGAMPGAGATIAAFLCYSEAKRSSKDPKLFGTGVLAGVAAPEAGNSAVSPATLIPLLTLGIPGGGAGATLIAALMMHGLPPGPTLMMEHGKDVYVLMVALFFISIFMYMQSRLFARLFAKIATVPQMLLIPNLLLLCMAGAFMVNSNMFDIFVLLVVAVVMYILKKIDFPAVPLVLGFILGPIVETNLRNALVMSKGSWSIFVTRPISLVIFILIIVFVFGLRKSMKRVDQSNAPNIKEEENKII